MPKTIFKVTLEDDQRTVSCDSGIKTTGDTQLFATVLSMFMEKDERISDSVLMAVAALAERNPRTKQLAVAMLTASKNSKGN